MLNPGMVGSTLSLLNFSQGENMPALNRVQLIGYLGKDPESRFTPTGKKVTHFSLGITQRWKTNGETKENTDWVYIEAWEKLGEFCGQYLHKGSLAYVEGRLKVDRYEEKGETRYSTKVVALQVQMLDRKSSEDPVMTVEEDAGDYEA
jgi:single-strand DNA-binding protein